MTTIRGTSGADTLRGGPTDDRIFALAGDDRASGGPGADRILGGDDDDHLRGDAIRYRITVENLAAEGGTFLTPLWFGAHDGSFDLYDAGAKASPALERLAEDGDASGLSDAARDAFAAATTGLVVGTDGAPGPIDPGEAASVEFDLAEQARFLSFASMVIPSNDAFVATPDDPRAIELIDEAGRYLGDRTFALFGANVIDAGTEQNTEEAAAFLNQTAPDQGEAEDGVVARHPGFNGSEGNPDGEPVNIFGGETAAGSVTTREAGDFTRNGGTEPLLRVDIERFSEPSDDFLAGGAGDDVLIGGAGRDIFRGGEGADRFVFEALDDRAELLIEFDAEEDVIDLSMVIDDPDDVSLSLRDFDGNTTLRVAEGDGPVHDVVVIRRGGDLTLDDLTVVLDEPAAAA